LVSSVGVGLGISLPLILVALTVDNITRFYNRITTSSKQGVSHVKAHIRPESKNRKAGQHEGGGVTEKGDGDGSRPQFAATDETDLSQAPEVSATEGLKKRRRTVSWADTNGHDLERGRE
jgi:hypothetical protein